jgi:hypothetical protein
MLTKIIGDSYPVVGNKAIGTCFLYFFGGFMGKTLGFGKMPGTIKQD